MPPIRSRKRSAASSDPSRLASSGRGSRASLVSTTTMRVDRAMRACAPGRVRKSGVREIRLKSNGIKFSFASGAKAAAGRYQPRSEEHTSELQSLMRISYAVFCLKKKKTEKYYHQTRDHAH